MKRHCFSTSNSSTHALKLRLSELMIQRNCDCNIGVSQIWKEFWIAPLLELGSRGGLEPAHNEIDGKLGSRDATVSTLQCAEIGLLRIRHRRFAPSRHHRIR